MQGSNLRPWPYESHVLANCTNEATGSFVRNHHKNYQRKWYLGFVHPFIQGKNIRKRDSPVIGFRRFLDFPLVNSFVWLHLLVRGFFFRRLHLFLLFHFALDWRLLAHIVVEANQLWVLFQQFPGLKANYIFSSTSLGISFLPPLIIT